jgi:hypothetical protein
MDFFAFDIRVCAPQLLPNESHCEKFLALSAFGEIRTKPDNYFEIVEIPLEIMVDLVFFPKWIILFQYLLVEIIGNCNRIKFTY